MQHNHRCGCQRPGTATAPQPAKDSASTRSCPGQDPSLPLEHGHPKYRELRVVAAQPATAPCPPPIQAEHAQPSAHTRGALAIVQAPQHSRTDRKRCPRQNQTFTPTGRRCINIRSVASYSPPGAASYTELVDNRAWTRRSGSHRQPARHQDCVRSAEGPLRQVVPVRR